MFTKCRDVEETFRETRGNSFVRFVDCKKVIILFVNKSYFQL